MFNSLIMYFALNLSLFSLFSNNISMYVYCFSQFFRIQSDNILLLQSQSYSLNASTHYITMHTPQHIFIVCICTTATFTNAYTLHHYLAPSRIDLHNFLINPPKPLCFLIFKSLKSQYRSPDRLNSPPVLFDLKCINSSPIMGGFEYTVIQYD